ncbi:MAG: hypothetical protein AB3N11_02415 [Arenibacterium sp.]
MELNRAIDGYCERLGPGLWAEPWNAVTNLAFILAALIMWQRTGGKGLAGALCAALFTIGVMSGLFHTHAVVWTAAADTLSILVFILIYLFGANRLYLGLGRGASVGGLLLFFPYAAGMGYFFARIAPWLGGSVGYAPIPVLILGYAAYLRRRMPDVATGLVIGALILVVSIGFRTVDEAVCPHVVKGTHFVWHVLNAIMLAWMIEVYQRAATDQPPST